MMTAVLLLIVVLVLVIQDVAHGMETAVEPPPRNETIRPWQYCIGCKQTVHHYLQLTAQRLDNMQKKSKPAQTVVEGNELSFRMCDDVYFRQFQPFVEYSCIKLMNDGAKTFLEEFTGAFTSKTILDKTENFQRKRHVRVLLIAL
jgi:hypothetical protein